MQRLLHTRVQQQDARQTTNAARRELLPACPRRIQAEPEPDKRGRPARRKGEHSRRGTALEGPLADGC